MGYVKTVRVKTDSKDNDQGFYDINESDFKDGVHELYVEQEKKAEGKKPDPEGDKKPEQPAKATGK